MEVKQKGLQQYLEDDPSLAEKLSYEEFQNRVNAPRSNDNSDEAIEKFLEFSK